MRLNQVLIVLLLSTNFLAGLAWSEDESGGSIDAQIQGRWEVVAGVSQGRELLPAEFDGTYVAITVNQIVTTDRDENQRFKAIFVIDESKSPVQITMTSIAEDMVEDTPPKVKQPTNSVASGILKIVTPSQWILCYALPGAEPPTAFDSPVGSKLMLFKLERKSSGPVLNNAAK